MTLSHLYTDTVDILRATITTSDLGQARETWLTIASAVSCEVQPRSENYPISDKGYIKEGSYFGFFELGTDVERGDHILFDGVTYDVVGVMKVRNHHLEVLLEEFHSEEETSSLPGS